MFPPVNKRQVPLLPKKDRPTFRDWVTNPHDFVADLCGLQNVAALTRTQRLPENPETWSELEPELRVALPVISHQLRDDPGLMEHEIIHFRQAFAMYRMIVHDDMTLFHEGITMCSGQEVKVNPPATPTISASA